VMGTGTRQAAGTVGDAVVGDGSRAGAGMAANPHEARRPAFIQLAAYPGMKRSEELDGSSVLDLETERLSLLPNRRPSRHQRCRFRSMRRLVVGNCLCRDSRYDHPSHFRIKAANAVAANNKISWIEYVTFNEIKNRSIHPRSLRLH
jgi:hypothetical protein